MLDYLIRPDRVPFKVEMNPKLSNDILYNLVGLAIAKDNEKLLYDLHLRGIVLDREVDALTIALVCNVHPFTINSLIRMGVKLKAPDRDKASPRVTKLIEESIRLVNERRRSVPGVNRRYRTVDEVEAIIALDDSSPAASSSHSIEEVTKWRLALSKY